MFVIALDTIKSGVKSPKSRITACTTDLSRYAGNREPNLSDLYDDPVLHAVLERDGLRLATLKDIVTNAQRRLVAQ